MKRNLAARILRAKAMQGIAIFLFTGAALAQSSQPAAVNQASHKAQPAKSTVPVLLVSDIHFEPFWDPAKVPQLAAAPVSEWKAILASAPSPDQQQRLQSLQQNCHVHGADSSFTLFQSSLEAMRAQATGAKFVTVSGDLLSHAFPCKYKMLIPDSSPEAYRAFVEKTLSYVMDELKEALPGLPDYVALGNNDSDCGDYRMDAHSEFLEATGKQVTKDFPASERQDAQNSFAAGGYYSVALPAPIENARLLVLNDIFISKNYSTCSGKAAPAAAAEQLAWLRQQLTAARANNQHIWVMAHIPPGVDLYSTARRMTDICGGQSPTMFLASEKMTEALVEFSDVVELAIFAHTHMDELRLLKDDGKVAPSRKGVAVKMVASISPIHGNHPSITLAQVDPSSAALIDYKVFAASNHTGVAAQWEEEYDFARSFHKTGFSSASIRELIAAFAADPGANTQASQNYIQDFSAGDSSPLLSLAWPQYLCTLSNFTPESFRSCVCPAAR
jgi:sphingomyelin phosphodiesterase acid-like 3